MKYEYSVAVDAKNKLTFLTLHCDSSSMTLEMNKVACEMLIRMLRSTYMETNQEENDDER